MPTYIHITEETSTESRAQPVPVRDLFPNGAGYVEIKADGSVVLSTPSGGGGGTGKVPFRETLTITATNTFPALSFTPRTDLPFAVVVNGAYQLLAAGRYTVNTGTRIITLTSGVGYGVLAGWSVDALYYTDDDISAPTITSISPASVTVGQTLTINGTGFTSNAVVTLGGQTVTAVFVSQTQLTAVIPALPFVGNSATVTTITGTASSTGFNFITPIPTVTSFTPTLATARTLVVITGTNFTGATAVRVAGANVLSFVVNSATQITADIAKTQVTGVVSVQNPYGTGTSAATLTIDQILPFARAGRVMTAPTTVINTRNYTASSQPANGTPFSAFDNNTAVWWLAANTSGQRLVIRFPFPLRISQYRIRQSGGSYPTNHYPKDWTLEGSANGTIWTVLDTKINQPINADQTVNIALTNEFEYYSINIAATNGFAAVISELTFDVT